MPAKNEGMLKRFAKQNPKTAANADAAAAPIAGDGDSPASPGLPRNGGTQFAALRLTDAQLERFRTSAGSDEDPWDMLRSTAATD